MHQQPAARAVSARACLSSEPSLLVDDPDKCRACGCRSAWMHVAILKKFATKGSGGMNV